MGEASHPGPGSNEEPRDPPPPPAQRRRLSSEALVLAAPPAGVSALAPARGDAMICSPCDVAVAAPDSVEILPMMLADASMPLANLEATQLPSAAAVAPPNGGGMAALATQALEETGGVTELAATFVVPPLVDKHIRVFLRDGRGAMLTAVQRRTGTWFWQISATVADGSRPASSSCPSREDALRAWVTRHGYLLAQGDSDRLHELSAPLAAATAVGSASVDETARASVEAPERPPARATPLAPPPHALCCPLCPGRTVLARPRNLVRHLATRHAGQQLGDRGAAVLRGIDQGVCGGCGAIRSFRSRDCLHCPPPVQPPRPAAAADIVVVPQARGVRPGRPAAHERQQMCLPADWTARVRALPGQTLPHIPACVREATALAMAESLEAVIADGPDRDLEQGRSKLLLAPPPRGLHLRSELEKRHELWRDRDWEALLVRAEVQATERERTRSSDAPSAASRGKRALQLCREKAYRKGVTSLTGSLAALTPEDEVRWARELLPSSALASRGAVPAGGDPGADGDDPPDDTADVAPLLPMSLGQQALRGVRFPALSGAGPTGTRPEHLREALLAKRRSVTNRLLRAVAELGRLGRAGELPTSARWILDSRVVFLSKPGSESPRPIRVGEVWRRLIAKRLVHDHQSKLQRLFMGHRQCGVALPGGADALVHLRRCLEQAAHGIGDAMVMLDLDLRNAFPSLEWPSVRAAVRDLAPELGAWTEWCHGEAAHLRLPCGQWTTCDRGAEQGDPLGPAYCGLVLIGCAEAGRQAVEARGGEMWDAWYMDDGQVLLPPQLAAVYLEAFDAKLAAVGGTRLAGGTFKSVARLVGSAEDCAAVHPSWSAGVVAATCKLDAGRDAGPQGKVLGVELDGDTLQDQLRKATQHTDEICKALRAVDDARAELAILRVSANACRVVHLLRAAGPDLDDELLVGFDEQQREALGAILGGPLADRVWSQASGSADEGGLGLRSTLELRYPAFLASRTEAKGLVEDLTRNLTPRWRDAMLGHWTATSAAAMEEWAERLPGPTALLARQLIDEGTQDAARRSAQLAGRLPRGREDDGAQFAARTAAGLLQGPDDPEHPDVDDGLQARLAALASQPRLDSLRTTIRGQGDWEGDTLLSDLQHSDTDHRWMWVLSAADDTVLSKAEFVDAVNLRLGADILAGPSKCARCGGTLDAQCRHALRCAPGPATRGHNRVRDTLLGLASLGDGASATEVRGLIGTAPSLRPADLLTTAAFGRLTALDVGIANPAARTAGADACVAMVSKKLSDYAPYLEELREDGVEYRPVVWTCWGRPHVDATSAIRSMAASAARRQGAVCAHDVERRTQAAVGVQLWKRMARMVAACRPGLDTEEAACVLPDAIAGALLRLGRAAGDSGSSCSSCSSHSSRSRCSSPCSDGAASPPVEPDQGLVATVLVHPPDLSSFSLLVGGEQRGAVVCEVAGARSAVAGPAASPDSLEAAASEPIWLGQALAAARKAAAAK